MLWIWKWKSSPARPRARPPPGVHDHGLARVEDQSSQVRRVVLLIPLTGVLRPTLRAAASSGKGVKG